MKKRETMWYKDPIYRAIQEEWAATPEFMEKLYEREGDTWFSGSTVDNPPKGDVIDWTNKESLLKRTIYKIENDKGVKAIYGEKTILNPFQAIPDCGHFKIKLASYSQVLNLLFGVKLKVGEEIVVIKKMGNRSMNRYMKHQVIRLNKARRQNNGELFWKIAEYILEKSNVFLIISLNKIHPQWHRKKAIGVVWGIIKKYKKLIRENPEEINYERLWIDKPNGGKRPLGVPKDEWRIYLGIIAAIMTIWLKDDYPSNQHGFFPHKGTLTAWKQIFSEVLEAKDIYEYDLKQFFPSIEIQYISNCLRKTGMPEEWVYLIENLNRSLPQTTVKGLEEIIDEQRMLTDATPETIEKGKWYNEVEGRKKIMGEELWQEVLREEFGEFPKENQLWIEFKYTELEWAMRNSINQETGFGNMFKGVPQGAATSCLLASMTLKETVMSRFKTVAYADDGIYYGENLPNDILKNLPQNFESAGIEYHEEKSGWVKKDGKWIKPIKFLGLEYDGRTNELRAKTRKGSRLIYNKEDLLAFIKRGPESFDEYQSKGTKWTDFVTSKLNGLIQNRLYVGRWDWNTVKQDFNYSFHKGSWASLPTRHVDLDTFNSSSYACKSILNQLKKTKKSKATKEERPEEYKAEMRNLLSLDSVMLRSLNKAGILKGATVVKVKKEK